MVRRRRLCFENVGTKAPPHIEDYVYTPDGGGDDHARGNTHGKVMLNEDEAKACRDTKLKETLTKDHFRLSHRVKKGNQGTDHRSNRVR